MHRETSQNSQGDGTLLINGDNTKPREFEHLYQKMTDI